MALPPVAEEPFPFVAQDSCRIASGSDLPLRNAWEPKWGCSISIAGKDRLDWALVLGASGGFGAATSRALAADGLNIFGVHLDRRATLPLVDQVVSDIESHGRTARFFNSNAVQDDARQAVIAAMIAELGEGSHLGRLRAVLHSIAFGNLLPYVSDGDSQAISPAQMEMTFNAMAHSLVYWVRDLVDAGLLANGGRVFAMTSEGATKIWPHYGAVSAVKATLDAHVRRLAFELAPKGITVNAIRAGSNRYSRQPCNRRQRGTARSGSPEQSQRAADHAGGHSRRHCRAVRRSHALDYRKCDRRGRRRSPDKLIAGSSRISSTFPVHRWVLNPPPGLPPDSILSPLRKIRSSSPF